MFKNKKIGSSQRVGESEECKLRMLRSDHAFQASPASMERIDQENVHDDSRKDIRASILEAEYKKAKAITAFQNHRGFC